MKRLKGVYLNLFQLAEVESSRAGKTGMEVGSVREKIIVALLIYKFGEANVETEIPLTEPEVDAKKAKEFREDYHPHYDILLVQINWNDRGGFYYIPLEVQKRLFDKIGRKNYIKLPKPGTNPRGVEITKEALLNLVQDSQTKKILINWQKTMVDFNPYKRWVDLWRED